MPGRPIETAAVVPERPVLATGTIGLDGLDRLIGALAHDGRTVIGPTVRDGAIVLDPIGSAADLPAGWTDEQAPGRYRLHQRGDGALFRWAVGANSWRAYLVPPRTRLWRAERRTEAGSDHLDFALVAGADEAPSFAFVGVRSCDLHAIAVHDEVHLGGAHPDPAYGDRRRDLFIVVVHCGDPAATCFCDSMGTGPRAPGGYDLALTELLDHRGHRFLVEAGSERGADLLATIGARPAAVDDEQASVAVTDRARSRMGRTVDTVGIRDLLAANLEHPRWDEVATRCLGCTNCTLVCPTCFCSTVEDITDLDGGGAERWRRWDSCFTLGHTHLVDGSVRSTHRDQYRQWLTHKLGTWIDQFGSSGCVGCGRCMTWCPVGIDLTEELAAIRADPAPVPATPVAAPSWRR